MNAEESRLNLAEPAQSGVYFVSHDDLDAIAAAADDQSLWCERIDLGECRNKQDLLTGIAEAMHFPASFGHNWDALTDCMRDLDWLPARGHVLLFEHGDTFGNTCPEDFDILLDILDQVSGDTATADGLLFAFIAFPDSAFESGELASHK